MKPEMWKSEATTVELEFVTSQIRKAEARLAFQATLVDRLPIGNSSVDAVLACEVLENMSRRLEGLREQKNAFIASICAVK